MKYSIKDVAVVATCISILFVQEQILSFLPNIQLTVLLLVVYSKKLGFIKTSIIVIIHSFLDCLVTGSLNIYTLPFMILGWLIIPIVITLFFKKTESSLVLAIMGILFSLVYSWIFIIPNVFMINEFINGVAVVNYLIADINFELLFACSSFVSILWLYPSCSLTFNKILKTFYD